VYLLIRQEGLDQFYATRKWDDSGIPPEAKTALDLRQFAEHLKTAGDHQEISVFIEGIRCASCVWLNEKVLLRTLGVAYCRINFATHTARIRWDPAVTDLQNVLARIQAIGYQPKPATESLRQSALRAESRDLLVRFGTAAFLSSQLMIYSLALYAGYFQGIDASTKRALEVIALALTTPVILYAGWPFIRGTVRGLRHLHFTMDSLIVTGACSAFAYSLFEMTRGGAVYFDTSAMIVTLILLGRYIESTAKGNASAAVERLAYLQPKEARIIRNGEAGMGREETVPLSSVGNGDLLKVLPGERIPVDGEVVSGESEVDESLITGESLPAAKSTGSTVIGGSINRFGALLMRVTKTGDDTVLAGIIRAVEDAQEKKPRIQILADRVVAYFVPAVLLVSSATAAAYLFRGASASDAVMIGISVIVIACPCSLGLATPLAILVFTTVASSRGVLVRGGDVIERAAKARRVVLDKTGTVTAGKPVLKTVIPLHESFDRAQLLRYAASVEQSSEHSIGQAIVAAVEDTLLPAEGFTSAPGRGVSAIVCGRRIIIGNQVHLREHGVVLPEAPEFLQQTALFQASGDTVTYMAIDGQVAAAFVIADMLRPEALPSVAKLAQWGFAVDLVSGDNGKTTEATARELGIVTAAGEISPLGKSEHIRNLQARGEHVIMVGDGINDAPALTEASVGVAMGRGTDIAMESADVILLRSDLALLPWFASLTRKTKRIISQNVLWSFLYNVAAIPLAMSGALHPIVAAGAMAASSLLVVINSLRIRSGTQI
jgi:Cu2+-exporting ATPase